MLYDLLKDKSKILTGKRVVRVEHLAESVIVHCKDGTCFPGDVVVGADGIHSKVRKEMRRYAYERGDGMLFKKDSTSKSCLTQDPFHKTEPFLGKFQVDRLGANRSCI